MTHNPLSPARDELDSVCSSCGEYFGDADVEYCPKSQRKCRHHCNHVWSHDVCDWCGFDASPIKIEPPALSQGKPIMSCECSSPQCACDCVACACHRDHMTPQGKYSPARDEENRRLANWLGWGGNVCGWETQSERVDHTHVCQEPIRHTQTSGVMDWESPHRCQCGRVWDSHSHEYRKYPDFYTDEAANALLLEDMPAPELYCHPPDHSGPEKGWRCRPDWGLDFAVYDPDRKTAIVKAYIAYREAQK